MNIETETAWLDGIELEFESLQDTFSVALGKYEYPYANGADLENMGQRARTIRMRCFFWDEADHRTYNDHIALVNLITAPGHRELIHPKYGILTGEVENISIRHDDRQRCAEIDLDFVEQMRNRIEASETDVVENTLDAQFVESITEQGAAIETALIGSGLDAAADLDPEQSLLAQIKGVAITARGYARQIDAGLGKLNAMANDVTQPVNSLVATIAYGVNLPGRILGVVDRCVERVARLHDGLISAPARFLMSLKFGLLKIEEDLDAFLPDDRRGAKAMMLRQVRIAVARRLALETAYVYGADRDARRQQKAQGQVAAFDTLGRYTPRPALGVSPMYVDELEATLADARTQLQAAIDADRSLQSLKEMALALEQTVSGVKSSSEKVITATVDGPMPLHILCLRYGLAYPDAERVMALNPGLRNPTFATGEVRLYV